MSAEDGRAELIQTGGDRPDRLAKGSAIITFVVPPSTPVGRPAMTELSVDGETWVPRRIADEANARAARLTDELGDVRREMQKLVGRMESAMKQGAG